MASLRALRSVDILVRRRKLKDVTEEKVSFGSSVGGES